MTFSKILSINDIGANQTHQAGLCVSRAHAKSDPFPQLPSTLNPKTRIAVLDEKGNIHRFSYTHYNNKLHELGTRNEYRLTGMTCFFREHGAKAGDVFTLDKIGSSLLAKITPSGLQAKKYSPKTASIPAKSDKAPGTATSAPRTRLSGSSWTESGTTDHEEPASEQPAPSMEHASEPTGALISTLAEIFVSARHSGATLVEIDPQVDGSVEVRFEPTSVTLPRVLADALAAHGSEYKKTHGLNTDAPHAMFCHDLHFACGKILFGIDHKKFRVRIHGQSPRPIDPHFTDHPARTTLPRKTLTSPCGRIRATALVLPHPCLAPRSNGLGSCSNPKGGAYVSIDGFSAFLGGDWLGLAPQSASLNLAQLCIDIPNSMADLFFPDNSTKPTIPEIFAGELKKLAADALDKEMSMNEHRKSLQAFEPFKSASRASAPAHMAKLIDHALDTIAPDSANSKIIEGILMSFDAFAPYPELVRQAIERRALLKKTA